MHYNSKTHFCVDKSQNMCKMINSRNSLVLSICFLMFAVIGSSVSQDTFTFQPRKNSRVRTNEQHPHEKRDANISQRKGNNQVLLAPGEVELVDKDKYYESDDHTYEYDDGALEYEEDTFVEFSSAGFILDNESELEVSQRKGNNQIPLVQENGEVEYVDMDKYYENDDHTFEYDDGVLEYEENTFVESSSAGIIFDHVDFILLRLKHISMRTSSNITEILAVQEREFENNTLYQQGWTIAAKLFYDSKRERIFKNTTPDSITQTVPEEYHIAIIAYTLQEPSMYYEFNKDTREVCSGNDIDMYEWKSYFKLLQLAVQTLGSLEERWSDKRRFMYRGASSEYNLKEGQILAFQHFISTSAALIKAEEFSRKTLFEFQGFYNGTAMTIWAHSFYENEEETLFSPIQVFQVDSIHVGNYYTRYVLVKHTLNPPSNDQTNLLNSSSSNSSVYLYANSYHLVIFLISMMLLLVNLTNLK